MKEFPVLTTPRLLLRAFAPEDAAQIQPLASSIEVARTTLLIPHPYPDGAAEEWIATHAEGWLAERNVVFAITLRETGQVIGAIGLHLEMKHDRGEIGYWIGVPFWSQGYVTEACGAVIDYGFEAWNLHSIWAGHFAGNDASGRVMRKNGMRHEGRMREHVKKWEGYRDIEMYSILRQEWEAR